jgi:hypothetical protein
MNANILNQSINTFTDLYKNHVFLINENKQFDPKRKKWNLQIPRYFELLFNRFSLKQSDPGIKIFNNVDIATMNSYVGLACSEKYPEIYEELLDTDIISLLPPEVKILPKNN